jgi:hypothetical protein
MAVDTALKRSSVIGLAAPWVQVLPPPDGSVDDADRVSLAYSYSGTDFSGVSGTASNTLNTLGQSASGTAHPAGPASNTLNQLGQSAAGAVEVTGTASNTLNTLGSSATGTGGDVTEEPASGGYTYLRASDRRRTREEIRRLRALYGLEDEEKAEKAVEKAAVATLKARTAKRGSAPRRNARATVKRSEDAFINAHRKVRGAMVKAQLAAEFDRLVAEKAKVIEELEIAEITSVVLPALLRR